MSQLSGQRGKLAARSLVSRDKTTHPIKQREHQWIHPYVFLLSLSVLSPTESVQVAGIASAFSTKSNGDA